MERSIDDILISVIVDHDTRLELDREFEVHVRRD
jgi:hypothetical protein